MRLNDCLYCLQKMSTPTFFCWNSVTLYLYRLSSSSKHLLRLSKDCCIFFVSKSFLSVRKNLIFHCMHILVVPLFLVFECLEIFFVDNVSWWAAIFRISHCLFCASFAHWKWYTALSRKLMAWCDDCGNKRLYLVFRRPSSFIIYTKRRSAAAVGNNTYPLMQYNEYILC